MTPAVVVVGLGPAGPDLVTPAAQEAIDRTPTRFLRTDRHPAASVVAGATSFDAVYDRGETLTSVYRDIVERLVAAAEGEGRVLYAVPGSPAVAERTVELLRSDPRVSVDIVPGLSFVDLAWVRLGVDPVSAGVRIVDGHQFAADAGGGTGPLLVGQCDRPSVLSEVKLAYRGDLGDPVVVLQRLGLPDERIFTTRWEDLDRDVEPDHLTSLYAPAREPSVAAELQRLVELVATLRRECPWDREQTHRSLTRHLLEEAYEVVEAIDRLDEAEATGFDHLEEELGDLLFHVVFQATLAAEAGEFTLAEVAHTVHDKLYARHPHVFGDVEVDGAAGVMRNWEQIKREEKGRASIMDGIPASLPALLLAAKVQKKAASAGLGYESLAAAGGDLESEMAELVADPGERELGDVLFAATGVAQYLGVDPEAGLRAAARRFDERFRHLERRAVEAGVAIDEIDPAALDQWWQEAKQAGG